jgi:nucleotide-binding universal stress UspA family protein
MSAIRRILCPTDFSDGSRHALDYACVIAQWHGATITLFHARAAPPAIAYATSGPMMPSELITLESRVEILAVMSQFAATEAGGDIRVEFEIGEGHAAAAILAAAATTGSDVIVMGTHGRSGFERLVLGSVTEKVLRKASCPVLTVPPRAPDAVRHTPTLHRRIVCGVDFSDSSMEALNLALSLAQEVDARVTILHVIELPPGLPSEKRDFVLPAPRLLQDYVAAAESDARELLKAAVPESMRARGNVDAAVAVGKPYQEILRIATAPPADLIVMGVKGRGVADLLFFGSTAQNVVRQATCPVLTLRTA